MTERVIITLPLPQEQRDTLSAFLAEFDKACEAAYAEYVKVYDAACAEYDKVRGAAWAEYVKMHAAARAEYDKVRAAARAEYVKVRAAARAEYVKVRAAARAEYVKVRAAAWAEYVKGERVSPLVAWIIAEFMADEDRSDEAMAVLKALADGATLGDLCARAKRVGWCDDWDDALAAAQERFDIRDTASDSASKVTA